jgi:hypothetical protein
MDDPVLYFLFLWKQVVYEMQYLRNINSTTITFPAKIKLQNVGQHV